MKKPFIFLNPYFTKISNNISKEIRIIASGNVHMITFTNVYTIREILFGNNLRKISKNQLESAHKLLLDIL
jgi:hypothetical protein